MKIRLRLATARQVDNFHDITATESMLRNVAGKSSVGVASFAKSYGAPGSSKATVLLPLWD